LTATGGQGRAGELSHLTARVALDDDVFRLDVAVDEVKGVDVLQRLQHLLHDLLESGDGEILGLPALSDILAELIQILSDIEIHTKKKK
jgi:hypothetical protein